MTLGESLRDLRQKSGLSQEDVAQKLFLSRQSISKWENGLAEPGVEKLKALAELYGVTVDALVGYQREGSEGPPSPSPPKISKEEASPSGFWYCVVIVKTVLVVISCAVTRQISLPFDWLLMLPSLFIRSPILWGIIAAMVGIQIALLFSLTASVGLPGPFMLAFTILLHGWTLWAVLHKKARAYFHVGKGA